jgi:Rod binding domain-containing protein
MRIGSELSNAASLSSVGAKPSDMEKLHKSAHEFEGMLFSSMWKEAQEGLDDDDGEDGLSVKMDGPLQAIGFQSLMGKATESGGLGIAKLIENSLAKSKTAGGHGLSALQDSTVAVDPADTFDLGLGGQPKNP